MIKVKRNGCIALKKKKKCNVCTTKKREKVLRIVPKRHLTQSQHAIYLFG